MIAMFLGAIGGGLFLLSLLFGFGLGMIVGWAVVTFGKTGFHIAFLGKPLRFPRAFLRPQSSWLTRGIIFLTLFIIFGGLHAASVKPLAWLPTIPAIQAIAVGLALLVIIYDGFLLSAAKGVPFWNTSLVRILFFVTALVGGAGLMLSMRPFIGELIVEGYFIRLGWLEPTETYLLIFSAFLILAYLWTMYYTTNASRESVRQLIRGRISLPFIIGVVIIGIAIPLATGATALLIAVPTMLLGIAAMLEVVGDFLLKYSVLRAGIHPPLI